MKTVEAIIGPNGEVRLISPLRMPTPRKALVTILEESPNAHVAEDQSDGVYSEDWNREENAP